MKNYKRYTIALLILGFTACSSTHDEGQKHSPFPVDNEVPNCAADGPGCEQFNPNKDNIKPCTREYMPVCGEVQIECVTTPCEPMKKTFSNACVLGNNKRARFLYDGACR
jgi:hypothetical protein